jgi:hypothetical protein
MTLERGDDTLFKTLASNPIFIKVWFLFLIQIFNDKDDSKFNISFASTLKFMKSPMLVGI